ncbi:hypothetical protein [Pseudomonas fluorescens]|nr:hypothetical protein [Pseudomonas fluorescens]
MHRAVRFASKLAPTRAAQYLWEPGLPAMNDNAVGLMYRSACIASKPGSHKIDAGPVGAGLARDER